MKTIITRDNLSPEKVREGFKNKFGMVFDENDREVRKVIAKEANNTLRRLQIK